MSRTVVRAVAVVLIVAALVVWLATGAHRGWTQTTVRVKRADDVTGITVDDYKKGFIAGVDFLAAALLGSGILAGASFLFRKKQIRSSN